MDNVSRGKWGGGEVDYLALLEKPSDIKYENKFFN